MRKFMMIAAVLGSLYAMGEEHVTWLNKVHDFGAFDEDTKRKTAVFEFVNTTSQPVTVISATATCGCTTPKYDLDPVAVGDTARIEVSYDPSGRPGRFEKQIQVHTSDTYDRTRLVIKGTVIGNPETIKGRYPVSMGPLKLRTGAAMFGKAKAGYTKMHYIDGYNLSGDTIRPTIATSPQWIEAKVQPEAVAPGEMMSIDLTYRGDLCPEWGIVTDSLLISPDTGSSAYPLPIIVIVEEDFTQLTPKELKDAPSATLSTDRITLDKVAEHGNEPTTGTAKLTNKGKGPLLVRRIYSEDPGISVQISSRKIKKNKTAEIKVTFDPAAQPTGIINARVTLITNDPYNPSQTIRVVGER